MGKPKLHGWKKIRDTSDGHYVSPCGEYHAFRMRKGTKEACWEVYCDVNRTSYIETAITLGEVISKYQTQFVRSLSLPSK